MSNRRMTLQEAEQAALALGPTYRAAAGLHGWHAIDSAQPMWHRLGDFELARIGLRRTDLAPMATTDRRAA